MKFIHTKHKLSWKFTIGVISLFFSVAALTACSGGSATPTSSSDGSSSGNSTTLTGVFVDSPVEGLHYQTDTINGFTDEHGTFMYHEGETVTFMIGNYQLGSAPGSHIMTPVDLVPGAFDEMHPTVTNMTRLLQSLDQDGNLENGITITELMHEEMTDRMIDMHKGIDEFEDYDMEALFDSLNMLGAFHDDAFRGLRTPQEAREHFRQTLMNDMPSGDISFGPGYQGDDTTGTGQWDNSDSGYNQGDGQTPMHGGIGERDNVNNQPMMN